jgi:hypothetical protein
MFPVKEKSFNDFCFFFLLMNEFFINQTQATSSPVKTGTNHPKGQKHSYTAANNKHQAKLTNQNCRKQQDKTTYQVAENSTKQEKL